MPLERTVVVHTALALLNEVGLDGLTVRHLAEQLGVQNPALYWHFKNKQELLNQMAAVMLAEAFAGLKSPAAGANWAAWLADVARRFHHALLAHRDGARLVADADLTGSEMFVVLDLALQVLQNAGFERRLAFASIVTIFDYALGATFEGQAEPTHTLTGAGDKSGAIQAIINPERLPALAAALSEVSEAASGERTLGFEMDIQLILAGMQAARPQDDKGR